MAIHILKVPLLRSIFAIAAVNGFLKPRLKNWQRCKICRYALGPFATQEELLLLLDGLDPSFAGITLRDYAVVITTMFWEDDQQGFCVSASVRRQT
jgi:hypothetical protein